MKYKGYNFRRAKKVVMLSDEYADKENCVAFGRACSKNDKGAILTQFVWQHDRSPFNDAPEPSPDRVSRFPVYARKVQSDGYSLTNLMYGKDGYMYLAYDGRCYVCQRTNNFQRSNSKL